MNFEHEIGQLKDTLVVMAELQRRQAKVQKMQAHETEHLRKSFAVHEQRMNHVDMRLAEITDKLDGWIGFINGQFRRPQ